MEDCRAAAGMVALVAKILVAMGRQAPVFTAMAGDSEGTHLAFKIPVEEAIDLRSTMNTTREQLLPRRGGKRAPPQQNL